MPKHSFTLEMTSRSFLHKNKQQSCTCWRNEITADRNDHPGHDLVGEGLDIEAIEMLLLLIEESSRSEDPTQCDTALQEIVALLFPWEKNDYKINFSCASSYSLSN